MPAHRHEASDADYMRAMTLACFPSPLVLTSVLPISPSFKLALVSLSVSPDGRYVLYNSLEGTTALWDLHSRNVVGKFESFSRQEADTEPGEFALDFYHYSRTLNASCPSSFSVVRVN